MLHHTLATPKETVTEHLDRFGKMQRKTHIQRRERCIGYTLHGLFCSWSCARAYGNVHHPSLRNFIGSWIYRILIAIANVAKADGLLPKNYHVRNVATAPHFSALRITQVTFNIKNSYSLIFYLIVTHPIQNIAFSIFCDYWLWRKP